MGNDCEKCGCELTDSKRAFFFDNGRKLMKDICKDCDKEHNDDR